MKPSVKKDESSDEDPEEEEENSEEEKEGSEEEEDPKEEVPASLMSAPARGVATRGIQIDYAASKNGARQKMSCQKSLKPVQKYRVWDSGRSPNELTQGMILVVRKTGVAIVSVNKWKLKERYREKLIKKVLGHESRYHVSP
ncbi:hypothetical protein PIB30_098345 [Stylosanthes scabra]|uniref:Uncharacterized protein n=1 Tax=Stylosanthes scabra TaxID=79078 RepID=A0ABU6WWF4_9FABA|nr:hypothetical protein [Stylosanthes scabra]